MVKVRIRIKNDKTTFSHVEFRDDTFAVAKSNPELQTLIETACKDSHLKDIQEVRVFSDTEW
ncbi:MAG: hypothetical protein ACTSQE_12330 [Candidatus Heimdallarchaeaceae archaeon]